MTNPVSACEYFDPDCRRCERLSSFLDGVKRAQPHYHARPVAPFGDAQARLLIVGLAPGMHGANRTGRPFTGDHAGILLYATLHKFGWASVAQSLSADDGLRLVGCRISNAVKCLPPANKPLPDEVRNCNVYLKSELVGLAAGAAVLALGSIAHRAVLQAFDLKPARVPFAHGGCAALPGDRVLFGSYHCSRYNTQTRRLTTDMFEAVFHSIAAHVRRCDALRSARLPA